ncbi:uncharacterized protein At1g51745-like [Andrographis paniculata]|uniref:uncharacterized protein At1g51745-like n=1 Tax=Andrographis paniculata TaxID=175694 RepID=UPI0021E7C13F|nr:uncharacterized protein At1g51745-like [Andrographis paniculata]XP_051147805.1 uncharacterized protein At1g51745-like [Andrographis paniculata]
MGSFGEDPNKGIDATVGGLVWVRRRNGSWWPGRIVGPEELPDGCISTPRAGTPVKLLGREDASVDWYNLERSKRVKPFRCGEYNDCIEKAKASASVSHPSKKSVKYARREEAILEALELERIRLEKACPNLQSQDEEQQHADESPTLKSNEMNQDIHEDLNIPEEDLYLAPEVSQSGVSFEGVINPDAIMEESKRWRTPNDSEDDGIMGAKRMKGLEDLGMGVLPSPKRKRSHGAANDTLKRKSRRRTLTKVLECTAMVPVPEKMPCPTESSVPGAPEGKVSGLDSNEFKLNNSVVVNNNSDSTGVSCDHPISLNTSRHSSDPSLNEEKNSAGLSGVVSTAPQKISVGAQSSQSSHVETASLGNEEHNETGSTSSGTADIHNIGPIVVEKGASKWQLKGKRNSRPRKIDTDDDEAETGANPETRGWNWNAPQRQSRALTTPQRVLPCRQSRFTVNPKFDAFDFSPPGHRIPASGLYDVAVEVRVSPRSQHVPFISLMSKSSGQAIIGHPVTVEALVDDDPLVFSECHSSNSERDYKNPTVKATKRKGHGRVSRSKKRRGGIPTTKSRRNVPSSKKVRRLSSLTNLQRQVETKLPTMEKIGGPSVACVPLKVVFSRINAALNG